ncbi:MAG: serine protease [Nostoc sp. S4]|nr:serine protease [Nostoc sp. S4]
MKRTLVLIWTLACVCVPLLEPSTQAINFLVIAQTTSSKNKSDTEITSIAKKITVQIFQANSQQQENLIGTGFIVKKQTQQDKNYIYQVLTNDHVVKKLQSGYQYQIKTDGDRIYKASLSQQTNKFNNYDLAILTFTSSVGYQTAKLGHSDRLQPEQKVFVAGFPCESTPCKPKLTVKSGIIAPQEFLLQGKTLVAGYKIAYDIDVQPGTSGGPIIDTVGEVVGVNGRSKSVESPFANAPDPYTFTDNTQPDKNIKLLMRYFAWGIPIETYTNLDNINLSIKSTPQSSLSENPQRHYSTNSKNQSIGVNNRLINIIIIITIFVLVIAIVWYCLNMWNKYKSENQPKIQAKEEQQKEQESHVSSQIQQPKITEQEQKASSWKVKFQQWVKALDKKKHYE